MTTNRSYAAIALQNGPLLCAGCEYPVTMRGACQRCGSEEHLCDERCRAKDSPENILFRKIFGASK